MIKKLISILYLIGCFTINAESQEVTTYAGSGIAGGTNGQGLNAQFNQPYSIYIDSADNLFITEPFSHRIRRISNSGLVTTFTGTGNAGFQDGNVNQAQFYYPWGVYVSNSGEVIIGDNLNERIRKISNGVVTTIAGSGSTGNLNGPALSAQFNKPYGVCMDDTGNVYFVDRYNHQVKKITLSGSVVLVAGVGYGGYVDGPGLSAQFHHPQDISIDAVGNLYVSDRDNNAIRKITPTGIVSTIAGGGNTGFVNGMGTSAKFNQPHGIFADNCGNIYVADLYNHAIRKVSPSGMVSTIAGNGTSGYINGNVSVATFNLPWDVVKDSKGNLFVTDANNNRIRKISREIGSKTLIEGCNGSTIQLKLSPADSVNWIPSNYLSCNNCTNPVLTFSNISQYFAYSYTNCEVRIDTFIINSKPSSLSGNSHDINLCNEDSIQLSVVLADSVLWSPTNGLSCVNCYNPVLVLDTIKQYIATSYNNCNITIDTFKIKPEFSYIPGSSTNFELCKGNTVDIKITSADSIKWTPSIGLSCNNCFNPTLTAYGNQQYLAYVYNECNIRVDTFNLITYENTITGSSVDINFCLFETIELHATPGDSIFWESTEKLSCNSCLTTIITPSNTTQVLAKTYSNCDLHIDTFNLMALNQNIDAGNDTLIFSGNLVTLKATGSGNFSWSPVNEVSCVNCISTIVKPTVTTTFYLTSEDDNGCILVDSVTVYVDYECLDIILPNAFSPNNDGINDVFGILKSNPNYEFLSFQIYNRWGNIVYEGSNFSSLWDGTYNQEDQPSGVFAYIIKYKCKGEVHIKKGNVTLIR